jgi:NADH-quinone oxidoreductase subunit L
MFEWLWLIPALPLAGFLLLVLGQRLGRAFVAVVGLGSIGLSMIVALAIAARFFTSPPPQDAYTQVLWTWMRVGDFSPHIGLYLDALCLIMMLVVTGVSFFIHLYSAEFMADDEGYGRFFA